MTGTHHSVYLAVLLDMVFVVMCLVLEKGTGLSLQERRKRTTRLFRAYLLFLAP